MRIEDNAHWVDLAVEAGTLREAMVTRASIEQAKGVIMTLRRCDPDQAFDELRAVSQNANLKLNVVAETLIAMVGNQKPEDPRVILVIVDNWVEALRSPAAPTPSSYAERAWRADD
jgi:hypothetical protein